MIILKSRHRPSHYKGIREMAAHGLHGAAFELFKANVPPKAKVLDLGSGAGAWATRLHDAGYEVTACDLDPRNQSAPFPYHKVDLNQNFSASFDAQKFDAISVVEVIEHLENPRHLFRQIDALLQPGGIVFLSTPNASGLYSRLRFFVSGNMAMFTDVEYAGSGHITPLTAWQLDKVFRESKLQVLERRFHDAPFFPPRSSGDLAKIAAWLFFRPFMFGTVGGQNIMCVLKK